MGGENFLNPKVTHFKVKVKGHIKGILVRTRRLPDVFLMLVNTLNTYSFSILDKI